MKKKWLFCTVIAFVLLCPFDIWAMTPYEVAKRGSKCKNYELAEALKDGSLERIDCYDTYKEAKEAMDEDEENDNLVIIERNEIIDAKYAVVDYDIDYPSKDTTYRYIDVFTSETSSTTNGAYIRGGSPDDAILLDYDHKTRRAKIKVANLTGWIEKTYRDFDINAYEIVPLVWVETPQYYKVTKKDSFIHYFPGNVYGTKGTTSFEIDKQPEMLDVGEYYSYDGHYFYTSMKDMIDDYKEEVYEHAVNKDEPYYNYYQYLSFRTLTNHDENNINLYLKKRVSSDSKMLSTAEYFIDTQNKYGVNAVLMLAIGMNESAGGSSNLAQTKNNLFGLNAVDASPGQSANYFKSIEDCINTYGYVWLSYWYLEPGDFHFMGANLGTKSEGLNYKYASDPFWAEKAAHYYYDLDKMFGFLDRNSYQVAVLNDDYEDEVYAKKTPGGDNVSKKYYQYTKKDMAVVVLEEVEGPEVKGNNIWYKIQSDPNINADLEYHGDSKSKPRVIYTWATSRVYVPAAYFTKVNTATGNIPELPDQSEIVTTPRPTTSIDSKVEEIIKEADYKNDGDIFYGIEPDTKVKDVIKRIEDAGGEITVTDDKGRPKTSGKIGTGDIINIMGEVVQQLEVLIYGDIDGDGEISAVDYVQIKNSIMSSKQIKGIYRLAADIDGNDEIDAVDYVQIKNYIMGKKNKINN